VILFLSIIIHTPDIKCKIPHFAHHSNNATASI